MGASGDHDGESSGTGSAGAADADDSRTTPAEPGSGEPAPPVASTGPDTGTTTGTTTGAPSTSTLPPPPDAGSPGAPPPGWGGGPPAGWVDPRWPTFTPPPKREPTPPPTADEVARAAALLAVAAGVGILVDVFLRGGPIGVGAALTIATVTVGLLALAPDRSPERWAFAGLALLASVGLVIRASPWIVVLDWVAALGFLGLAASATPDHPVVGSSLSRLAFRSGAPPVASAASGPVTLVESMSTIRRRPRETGSEPSTLQRLAPGVVRGLILAVPTVALLGALLASADGVFASFFDLPTPEVGGVWSHLFLIGSGAAAVAGLARWTRDPQPAAEPGRRPLGPVEALVVLGGMTVLYALFALAQVVATTGGDARVQATTGLTYAEYARSGFFQLLWCAAITIAVLLGLRAMTRPGGPRQQLAVRVLSATTCALTLVVVGTAITRLELYRDAYGLTMLRLACTTFGWVLGVAFVLLGVRMLQTGARDWLPAGYLGLAVVTLGWWNLSNPEARVAETNLQQVATTGLLDVDYLDSLSDDAIPTILGGLDDLPPDRAGEIRERLCRPIDPGDQREDLRPITRSGYSRPGHVVVDPDGVVRTRPGILAHNVARESARAALQECADEVGR